MLASPTTPYKPRVPLDLVTLLRPRHTALVTQECQRGVIGDRSVLPELARAAAPMIANVACLAAAARQAGVTVVHCTAVRRADRILRLEGGRLRAEKT